MKNIIALLFILLSGFATVADDDEFGTNNVSVTVVYTPDDRWALRRIQARKENGDAIASLNFTNYVLWSLGQQRTNTLATEMKLIGDEGLGLFSKAPPSVQGSVLTMIGLTNIPPSFAVTISTNSP